jgi:hypothetical protein
MAAIGPSRKKRSPELATGCWGSSAATVVPELQPPPLPPFRLGVRAVGRFSHVATPLPIVFRVIAPLVVICVATGALFAQPPELDSAAKRTGMPGAREGAP